MISVDRVKSVSAAQLMPYLLGAVVGAVAVVITVDHGLLLGRAEAWRQVGGDTGVSLAVLRYFIAEGFWSNPFTVTHLGEGGIALAANDALPLLAFFARIVSAVVDVRAELWLGGWLIGVFVAQALSAVYAVRSWSVKNIWLTTTTAVIAVTLPGFVQRSEHIALLGQFWIFLAIGFIGRIRFDTSSTRVRICAALFPLGAWLTHPYLGIMATAIIGCSIVGISLSRRKTVLALPFSVGAISALAFSQTDVSPASLIPDTGSWAWLGTSVLAPITPQGSSLLATPLRLGTSEWEAMNWLGFGGASLVVIGIGLGLLRGRLSTLHPATKGLMAALVILTSYSVTFVVRLVPAQRVDLRTTRPMTMLVILFVLGVSVITFSVFGRHSSRSLINQSVLAAGRVVAGCSIVLLLLVRFVSGATGGRIYQSIVLVIAAMVLFEATRFFREPWFTIGLSFGALSWIFGLMLAFIPSQLELVTSTLRGSGRFMWPLVATLLVGSAALLQHLGSRALLFLCIACSVLQVLDTTGLRNNFSGQLMHGVSYAASSEVLQESIGGADVVHIRPTLGCLSSASGFEGFYDVVIAASWGELAVDPAVRSRAVKEDCSTTPPVPNDAVIAIVEQSEVVIADLSLQSSDCDQVAGILLCQT